MVNEKDIGTLRVNLTLNSDDFEKNSKKATEKVDQLDDKCQSTKQSTAGLQGGIKGLGSEMLALAANPIVLTIAGIGALAAACAECWKVGGDLHRVFEDLQVSTGALDGTLTDLQASLDEVAATSASTYEALGTAMGNLNTYLGITGDELEGLTELFSDYARITGNDVGRATETASKAFNLWGVEVEDMDDILNKFYYVSQSTGASVESLFQSVTSGQYTLSKFGFSLEESAQLLGALNKYGIDASGMLTGMDYAFRTLTAKGIEPSREEWDNLIESISNATSETEAMGIATEMFGARNATAMVAAIKASGKALTELTVNSEEATNALNASVAAQANGFDEKWQAFSNRMEKGAHELFLKMEPILTKLLDAVDNLLTTLDPILTYLGERVMDFFDWLSGAIDWLANAINWLMTNIVEPAGEAIKAFLDFIQPAIDLIKTAGDAIGGFIEGISNMWNTDNLKEYNAELEKTGDLVNSMPTGMDVGISYGQSASSNSITFNNNINVQGSGYATEDMARVYQYDKARGALISRY